MCKIIICGCSHVENVNMKNASTIFFCRKSSGDAAAMTAGDFFKTEIYVSHEILPETREFMFLPAMKEEGGEPAEEPHKEQVEVLAFTDADSNEDFPPDNVNVKQEDSSDEFTPEHSKKTKQPLKRKKVRGRPPKTIKGKKRAKKNDPLDEEEQNTEPESDTNEDNVDDPESSVNPEEDRSIDQSIEIPSTSLGEGPYTCQICKKTYATKANFHSHVLSHQGISNFFCEICGKSIDTRGAWKHMQSHEDINLNCPVCNKPFATPARLDRHVKTTHSESFDPLSQTKKSRLKLYSEEDVMNAFEAIEKGMTFKAAAQQFQIPITTLYKKLHERFPGEKRKPKSELDQKIKVSASMLHKPKRKPRRSSKYYSYTEEDMNAAYTAVLKGLPIKAAARKYQIPATTLHGKITGKTALARSKCKKQRSLNTEQELALVQWIMKCEALGHKLKRSQILDAVQKLCAVLNIKTQFTNGRPGLKWYSNFMGAYPILGKRMQVETGKELSMIEILQMRHILPEPDQPENTIHLDLDEFIKKFGDSEESLTFQTLKNNVFWPGNESAIKE